jgi:hypothetical protein
MATTTTITSTYAGEFAGKYVSAALLSGNTIDNGLIEIKPNVKYKEVLKRVALGDIVADATCDFTDISSVDLTERILEPKQLEVNLELCKDPFRKDWEAIQMGYSSHDVLPKNFSDYFIGLIADKVAQKTEKDIWNGTAGAGSFDGFATLLAADADLPAAQEIAGATVTAANVVDELAKVNNAIPSTIYGKDDLYIYVSQNVYRAYVTALGGFASGGQGANGYMAQGNNQEINVQYFANTKVVMANGLPDNTMIAAEKSNLFFGTGLLSDHNLVKVLDMSDLDGSDNVRFIMKYSAGVQYAVVEDIVTYGITNAAN